MSELQALADRVLAAIPNNFPKKQEIAEELEGQVSLASNPEQFGSVDLKAEILETVQFYVGPAGNVKWKNEVYDLLK